MVKNRPKKSKEKQKSGTFFHGVRGEAGGLALVVKLLGFVIVGIPRLP